MEHHLVLLYYVQHSTHCTSCEHGNVFVEKGNEKCKDYIETAVCSVTVPWCSASTRLDNNASIVNASVTCFRHHIVPRDVLNHLSYAPPLFYQFHHRLLNPFHFSSNNFLLIFNLPFFLLFMFLGCDGTGKIQGGIATVSFLSW
jgi:hypothetical protein